MKCHKMYLIQTVFSLNVQQKLLKKKKFDVLRNHYDSAETDGGVKRG